MATGTTVLPTATAAAPGRWIGLGWGIVREDLGTFVLITLVGGVLWLAVGFTVIGHFVVGGPLISGLFIATRRRMLEGRIGLVDLFGGFNFFMDSLLICLLTSIFALAGLLLCIFPVFIVWAFYLFPYLFMVDRRLPFWEAMEASRRIAERDLMGYVIFVILLALLNLLGLMLAGVGLLLTIPVTVAAMTVAYRDVVGFQERPSAPHGPVIIP